MCIVNQLTLLFAKRNTYIIATNDLVYSLKLSTPIDQIGKRMTNFNDITIYENFHWGLWSPLFKLSNWSVIPPTSIVYLSKAAYNSLCKVQYVTWCICLTQDAIRWRLGCFRRCYLGNTDGVICSNDGYLPRFCPLTTAWIISITQLILTLHPRAAS